MSVQIRGWSASRGPIRWTSQVVEPPEEEPLSLEEAKGYALIPGDDEDQKVERWIKVAREVVELRTGLALLTQVRDVFFDRTPTVSDAFVLPFQPVQAVLSVTSTAPDGTETVMAANQYVVQDGRLWLADAGAWATDLRAYRPWRLRMRVGYASIADIPAALIEAVGIYTGHLAGVAPADLETFERLVGVFERVELG